MNLSSKDGGMRSARKATMLAVASVLALALIAASACSPQKEAGGDERDASVQAPVVQPAASAAESEDAAVDYKSMGYSKFTDKDSGAVEANKFTETFVNDGNRGCNACHEDLFDLVENINPALHLASSDPGFGHNANWNDCYACHNGEAGGGIIVKDAIHNAHYGSTMFVDELDGNCFSCHALDKVGDYVMYDQYRLTSEFGGFTDLTSERKQAWVKGRKWPYNSTAGITIQKDMAIANPTFSQEPSAEEDRYSACNLDVPEVNVDEWRLNVTGVKNPRSFTFDEIKALPSVERTIVASCAANTTGSYQVANLPVKGVLLEEIIEACGGLEDDMQSVNFIGADGWSPSSLDCPRAMFSRLSTVGL